MLRIGKKFVEEMVEHAKAEFPNEACGILAGIKESVEKIYKMANVERSPEAFSMDAKEQFKVMKDIRNGGFEMIAVYHSHPHSRAYPSARDVQLAFYPECSYVIISFLPARCAQAGMKKANPDLCAFRIQEGKISEEQLTIE